MDSSIVNVIVIALYAIGIMVVPCALIITAIKKKNKCEYLEELIDTGEYKVYLDGKLLEDPDGIDVRQYLSQVDEYRKIIRFTTNHSVTVNNIINHSGNDRHRRY